MHYWAVGRLLGMSEEEFWESSQARVFALYRVKVWEWDRTRDAFGAHLLAATFNKMGVKKDNGQGWSGDDVLLWHYPKQPQPKMIERDLDRGAGGNWQMLKANLRNLTEVRVQRKRARRG